MKRAILLYVTLALCITPGIIQAQEEIRWIEFPDSMFEVNGLPWFNENSPDLYRLPKRLENVVRPPVWGLAKSPSGGRIRFSSDCSTLGIQLEYPQLSGMRNMHTFGQSGVDLYTNGIYFGTAIHDKELEAEHFYFKDAPVEKREFVLYLPLYNGVKIKAIGVNPEAVIEKARPFALPKPVVYYGTSITQGGCASRSGMSYQAILSRRLNLDFVNLGFSGNGKGEKELAQAVAEIDASCFVLDFMANNKDAESLAEVYEPFVRIVREKHPEKPIVLVTRIYATAESRSQESRLKIEAKKDVIRDTAAKLIAEGGYESIPGGRSFSSRSGSRGWLGRWLAPKRSRFSSHGGPLKPHLSRKSCVCQSHVH